MEKHMALEKCWYIANGPSVHYGELEVGQEIVTGQNTLAIYSSESEFMEKLKGFGIEYNQDTFGADSVMG